MKKILKHLFVFSLVVWILFGFKTNFYAAGASLSGPSTVRAGDTITLNLNLADTVITGMQGELSYDASQLTFLGASSARSGWEVEANGAVLMAYDNNMTNPISGSGTVLTLKFKVNSVATGASIRVAVNNIIISNNAAGNNLGSAVYTTTIAAPLSSNTNLSSLSVKEGTLSPKFSKGTTSYSIGPVDYSVSKLTISYKTEDGTAKVSVSGNSLSVGENTVSVVVKAQNGATKTYKISVVRKQDPNYVPSSDATLGGITISNGIISPTFSSDKTDYIVYLPYEFVGKDFSVTGTAKDTKASGVTGGVISPLKEGVNKTTVICKAEDGTEKTYKITVMVMPAYDGKLPVIGDIEEPETEGSTEVDPGEDKDASGNKLANGIVGAIIFIVILLLIGALVYALFFLNQRNQISKRNR